MRSPPEYAKLASAYQFMRHIEHRLQFDEDRQTHTLPADTDQLDLLARKMPQGSHWLRSAGSLERELDHHFTSVQDLYDRVIHSRLAPPAATVVQEGAPSGSERAEFPSGNLRRYLDVRAPAFAQLIANSRIATSLNNDAFESFLEKAVANPTWLEMLENNGELGRCTLDVFEHSQYFADQLVSHTELLAEVSAACGEKQGRTGFIAPREPDQLRRYFRRQMVRVQSDSVYHRVPVFKTLKRTSELAESIIIAAYQIAVAEVSAGNPPVDAHYAPSNQMMGVAL